MYTANYTCNYSTTAFENYILLQRNKMVEEVIKEHRHCFSAFKEFIITFQGQDKKTALVPGVFRNTINAD